MPNSPFLIAGLTKDAFGNVVSGVAITVSEDTNNEVLTDTSDANGEYSVNLGDIATQWVAGSTVSITGTKGNYESKGRTYTIVVDDSTELNINQDLVMNKVNPTRDFQNGVVMSFGELMSRTRNAFWKGVEEKTVTASFADYTTDGEFLEIPQDHVVYITQMIIGAASNTDDINIKINKNSSELGTGSSTQVGKEISLSKTLKTLNINFVEPIRIPYNSTSAKSVVLNIKGGTTDAVTVSIKGFILNENE